MKSAINGHGFKLLTLSMLNTSFQCRRCCWSGSVAKTLSIWDQSEIHDPIFSLLTYLLDNHTLWCRIIETLLCTRCSYDCHWFIKNRRNVVRCLQRKQQPRNCSSCKCCCIFVLPALCFGRFSRWMQQFSRLGEKLHPHLLHCQLPPWGSVKGKTRFELALGCRLENLFRWFKLYKWVN